MMHPLRCSTANGHAQIASVVPFTVDLLDLFVYQKGVSDDWSEIPLALPLNRVDSDESFDQASEE